MSGDLAYIVILIFKSSYGVRPGRHMQIMAHYGTGWRIWCEKVMKNLFGSDVAFCGGKGYFDGHHFIPAGAEAGPLKLIR